MEMHKSIIVKKYVYISKKYFLKHYKVLKYSCVHFSLLKNEPSLHLNWWNSIYWQKTLKCEGGQWVPIPKLISKCFAQHQECCTRSSSLIGKLFRNVWSLVGGQTAQEALCFIFLSDKEPGLKWWCCASSASMALMHSLLKIDHTIVI